MNRRELLGAVFGAAGGTTIESLLAPVRSLAAEAKRVPIRNVDTFDIQVPIPPGKPAPAETFGGGPPGRINVTRVETEAGVRGYSFLGSVPETIKDAREALVGQDLFAVEQHLKKGLIYWTAVEEAIWDAIGRIASQPVSRLLGGARLATIPVYCTYVWPGKADQSHIPPKEQSKQAALLKNAGFKAMKIRIFRPNYMDDVEACSEILAVGGSGFRVMVDRTATAPGLWSYPEGLAAALALQKAGVYWLEEPFDRNDFEGPARLSREVDILITGGEGYRGLAPYRECLTHNTYDILQPELRTVGGILTMRKVGALCEAWGVPIAPHASSGLRLAGRVQASAAMGSLYQEIGVLTPPLLPADVSEPFLPILTTGKQPFNFRNGEIEVPQSPGLGLELNEEAINRFRVEGFLPTGRGGGRGGRGGAPGRGGRGAE
jgi:D-galactarolactone cycloisomerase